jgi:hypothetical protein
MPDVGTELPSLSDFAEAQDRKRSLLGSDVTFLWPAVVTFAPGTPVDMEGNPYDPIIQPTASSQASASVRVGAFFKAVNRGGAANAAVETAIGADDRTRIFLSVAAADGPTITGASQFIFHGTLFRIDAIKVDEIVLGYQRWLVYGAAEGLPQVS